MTLAVRNVVFIAGGAITLVLLVGFLAGAWALLAGPLADGQTLPPDRLAWKNGGWEIGSPSVIAALVAAGMTGLLVAVSVTASAGIFRRVSSAEVYFWILFLITLSTELLRLGQIILGLAGMPPVLGVVVTRAVLFGRLLGSLSLFVAGLYTAGADYPRIGSVTLGLAAVAFLVVYFVPVDASTIDATLVHRTGGGQGLPMLLGFLGLGAIVNHAIGWLRGGQERGLAVLLSVTALVVGRGLLAHVPSVAAQVTATLLIGACCVTVIAVNRAHYLWY